MTAIGVVVAALIAWFENARARRLGIWVLLVVGLWDAARRAFPDGGARAALPIALLGVAVLGVVTTGAALADRWVELRGGSSTKPAGLRPWLPGVALATTAAIVAGVAGHVAALLLAALASGWGAWLMVPSGHRPVPLAAVVVTLLVVPSLWLFIAISGPEGLALSALPALPVSPAAERLLGLLLFASAVVLAGPWPFLQPGAGLVTAPVGALLLARLALPAVGAGLLPWRPAAFPLLVIGLAAAAYAGPVPALTTLGAFIGLASLEPVGVRGGAWLLVIALAIVLSGPGVRHATVRLTIACVAWLGVLDVMTGGLRAQVVYTVAAAALAALGLQRAASRRALTPLPARSIFAGRRGKSFGNQQVLSPEEQVTMAFTLPPLPYGYDALEPHIDEQTMRIHHDKHHAAYVNNLNAALESHPDLQKKSVEELIGNLDALPEAVRAPVRNNGGGHVNHTMFWEIMAPGGAREPSGELAGAIDKAFGGFGQFKEQFAKACAGRFGSGWGWLIADRSGGLAIESTPNQDTPLMSGKTPILGCDVWEHAYYLKYQNRRPDYVSAWWNTVNWSEVGKRYDAARKK